MTSTPGSDFRIDDLPRRHARTRPDAIALDSTQGRWTYGELERETQRAAALLAERGVRRGDRIAIYLEKRPEAVIAMLATARSGALFVPVNPGLRQRQVDHILRHSGARFLVTSTARLELLGAAPLPDTLEQTLLIDHEPRRHAAPPTAGDWHQAPATAAVPSAPVTEQDPVAILYTSGSTGAPKGVLLSHRNLVAGAESVTAYLGLEADDRVMAALPFSFDYGLNQVLSSLNAGACCRLTEYLSPAALLQEAADTGATTLAGVPTLWQSLMHEHWPEALVQSLRRMTNTGGRLPEGTVRRLRERAPDARLFLMYGLTEAFRSTFLPPELVDRHPSSIGHAVPNAEIAVVREDGTPCAVEEEGELVHRGAFVALGYWNDPAATAARFRPWPLTPPEHPRPEIAVWSGDRVYRDSRGLLYFAGRSDDMIKTSGYRVSPTEVEAVLLESGEVAEAAAIGLPDEQLGQAIAVVYQPAHAITRPETLQRWCRQNLPGYMQPRAWITLPDGLPHTAHGKIDRNRLRREMEDGTLQTDPAAEPHGTRT